MRGDPFLPENDAALDPEHWTGHTGCVILAPHLIDARKEGSRPAARGTRRPSASSATACAGSEEDELYNGGTAFKLTCRDETGVIVTIIADNYFGYCKKEVKTQIQLLRESLRHRARRSTPAVRSSSRATTSARNSAAISTCAGSSIPSTKWCGSSASAWSCSPKATRSTADSRHPLRPGARPFRSAPAIGELAARRRWRAGSSCSRIAPTSGRPATRCEMVKPSGGRAWRLIGTVAEGVLCHKPSTVSGGGKSEISKPITDAIIQGPVYVADFKRDFDLVEDLINRSYAGRFPGRPAARNEPPAS